jgi:hypothetical protein
VSQDGVQIVPVPGVDPGLGQALGLLFVHDGQTFRQWVIGLA